MRATLSLAGMMKAQTTLFDDLVLPEQVERDTVINRLLLETMELEVMISSGPIMQEALGVYSKSQLPVWQRYADSLYLNYDPFVTDETTETSSSSANTSGQNTGSDSTTREVTGFDSNNLQTAEKSTTELGTGNTVDTSGSSTRTRTGRAGKDPQDLVQKQIALAKENLVEYIVNDIKQQFCLLVY